MGTLSVIADHAMAADRNDTVGIITALPAERAAIRELMQDVVTTKVGDKDVDRGTIQDTPVVLVESGVGKVNAAATTQMLIRQFSVKHALFTGVAGGINPKRRIGDLVIGTCLAQHDYGMVRPDTKWVWPAGTLPFRETPAKDACLQLGDSSLSRRLRTAAAHATIAPVPATLAKDRTAYRPTIVSGPIVTGDEFIASEQKRSDLAKMFGAEAVEMEGAAFAQICVQNHIDCAVVRTVSDTANEHASIDFPTFTGYAAKNSAALVYALLSAGR